MRPQEYLSIVACVLLVACTQPANPPAVTDPAQAPLTFLHLNDTYRVDAVEDQTRGGLARVATVIRELQAAGHDVRLSHGGDFLFPSLESQVWNGEQMVEALNYIDDLAHIYAVPGNHEFDSRDASVVSNAIQQSRFDWLGDNLVLNTGVQEADAKLQRNFIFETVSGHKVGIFAITLHAEDGGNDRDYIDIDDNYLATARRQLALLSEADTDLIIGVTHLDIWVDLEIAALKAEYPQFLWIVGGHEHEPENHPGDAQTAAVMKGASNARAIWRIDVEFGADGKAADMHAEMLALDEAVEMDSGYAPIAKKWHDQLLAMMPFIDARIGMAAVPLDGLETTVRNVESNWANFIVDQMRGGFGEPAADFAFINGGTLRLDDFIADDITYEDLARTFGFSSFMRHLVMSGADFKRLLENGYRGEGPSKGYFPQVSGFRVCFDRSRPDGERIVQLQRPSGDTWRDIEPQADYTLVVPDFLYGGGDGYDFSKAHSVSRPGSELKYLVLDAIMREQKEGRTIGSLVDAVNPRIAQLPAGEERCFD
jgi:5'-nucleotidase